VSHPGAVGGVSPAIDSTGSTLLAVWVSYYTSGTGPGGLTVTDSKGNVWTPGTEQRSPNGVQSGRWYYCTSPTGVGTGHTVTVTGSSVYPWVWFGAFSGSIGFDRQAGAAANGVASIASGSVTPGQVPALVLTGLGTLNGSAYVLPSGYAGVVEEQTSERNVAGGAAYLIETGSPIATNPLWSWTGNYDAATAVVVFD